MPNGVVFVLHDEADKQFASDLTKALSPLTALPVQLGEQGAREVRFGTAATCVVVWSRALTARGTDAIAALAGAKANTLLCRLGVGAPIPSELSTLTVVNAREGDAVLAGSRLRWWIKRQAEQSERASPHHAAAAMSEQSPSKYTGVRRMAVRSAYGLAATLAVVGVVSPAIMSRAQATGAEHESASANSVEAASAPAAQSVAAPVSLQSAAPRATPALDQWVASAPAAAHVAPVAPATPPAIVEASAPAAVVEPSDAPEEAPQAADKIGEAPGLAQPSLKDRAPPVVVTGETASKKTSGA